MFFIGTKEQFDYRFPEENLDQTNTSIKKIRFSHLTSEEKQKIFHWLNEEFYRFEGLKETFPLDKSADLLQHRLAYLMSDETVTKAIHKEDISACFSRFQQRLYPAMEKDILQLSSIQSLADYLLALQKLFFKEHEHVFQKSIQKSELLSFLDTIGRQDLKELFDFFVKNKQILMHVGPNLTWQFPRHRFILNRDVFYEKTDELENVLNCLISSEPEKTEIQQCVRKIKTFVSLKENSDDDSDDDWFEEVANRFDSALKILIPLLEKELYAILSLWSKQGNNELQHLREAFPSFLQTAFLHHFRSNHPILKEYAIKQMTLQEEQWYLVLTQAGLYEEDMDCFLYADYPLPPVLS